MRPSVESAVQHLRKLLADLDREILSLLANAFCWQEKAEILRSVPGIGPVTAMKLIAYLPELGHLDGKKVPRPWQDWLRRTGIVASNGVSAGSAAVVQR